MVILPENEAINYAEFYLENIPIFSHFSHFKSIDFYHFEIPMTVK